MPLAKPVKSSFARKRKLDREGKPKIGEGPQWRPYEPKKGGHKLRKGTKAWDKENRPSFLTAKQAREYERIRKNANQRIYRKFKKLEAQFPGVTREELIQRGVLPAPFRKNVMDIKTTREYKTLRKSMRYVETKKYRREKTTRAREKFKMVTDQVYNPPRELMDWINACFDSMSVEDLLKWERENPMVVTDMFFAYTEQGQGIDEDEINNALTILVDSLVPYAGGRAIPEYLL